MAYKYWIKLHHEILDDKKMVKLDDRLWRRCIELFLLAGKMDDDGYLPELDEIAFALRISSTEQLETELTELVNIGILQIIDQQYHVKNFEKRQAKIEKAEYNRRRRAERQRQEYYQDE